MHANLVGQREEVQRASNGSPARHPVRILIATDGARGHQPSSLLCGPYHFEVPWNPARMGQRNGRIDRTLQPSKIVRCSSFTYSERSGWATESRCRACAAGPTTTSVRCAMHSRRSDERGVCMRTNVVGPSRRARGCARGGAPTSPALGVGDLGGASRRVMQRARSFALSPPEQDRPAPTSSPFGARRSAEGGACGSLRRARLRAPGRRAPRAPS